jgi:hypothetical protein
MRKEEVQVDREQNGGGRKQGGGGGGIAIRQIIHRVRIKSGYVTVM